MVTSHHGAGATWVPIIPEGLPNPCPMICGNLNPASPRSLLPFSPPLCSNLDIIHSPFSSFRSIPLSVRRVTSERSPLHSPSSFSYFPPRSLFDSRFTLHDPLMIFGRRRSRLKNKLRPRSDTMLIRTASGSASASPKRARLSDLT